MGHVMDVQFDADLQRIWALCDNTCSVIVDAAEVDADGTIVPDVVYAAAGRPAEREHRGLRRSPPTRPARRRQGGGLVRRRHRRPGHEGHALYSGTFPCDLDLDLDQTIDFPALPDISPIGTVTLHATASSGLPVSYSSTTPTVCTVSGSVVTPKAAGTCTIEAAQAGNADYNPAPPVSQSFAGRCQTLCLLNPTAAGSLRADGSTRVNASGGDVFVNSNACPAATLSGSARVSAAYIGGPGGFTRTGSGSYSPTPKLSAPSVDPLAGLAACPDLSGACPTGAPKPPVKVGGAARVHDRPGRVLLARGRRQRKADPAAGRVCDHRPGVSGGGRPPHRQRCHAVPRVHELPDIVLRCRSIAERGRQWRGLP